MTIDDGHDPVMSTIVEEVLGTIHLLPEGSHTGILEDFEFGMSKATNRIYCKIKVKIGATVVFDYLICSGSLFAMLKTILPKLKGTEWQVSIRHRAYNRHTFHNEATLLYSGEQHSA